MALERLRRRWEDNIKMDLREGGFELVGWIELAQVVGLCEQNNEPPYSKKKAKNFLTR
jgi:hypothetical protein